jgi:hypothetical protein
VPSGPPWGRLGVPLGLDELGRSVPLGPSWRGCRGSFWVAFGCLWDLLGRLVVPLGAPGDAGGQFRPPWRDHVAEVPCLLPHYVNRPCGPHFVDRLGGPRFGMDLTGQIVLTAWRATVR